MKPYSAGPLSIWCRVKLDANESPYDLPDRIKQLIFTELRHVQFNRYPDPDSIRLRRAFGKRTGLSLKWIIAGNGSDELILYLCLAFAKKKILFFSPTFVMYRHIGISCGVKPVDIPLKSNFELPVEQALKKKGIDIIFISIPNNPTGNCFKREDILEIIKKTQALVVLDEAYAEFHRDSFLPYLRQFENLVILRTFSKAFGLAGLRLGFALSHPYIIQEVNKVRLPYNISLFSQIAGRIVLENMHTLRHFIKSIVSERERVFKRLSCMEGVYPYPSHANFILFRTVFSSDKIYSYLVKKGVSIRNLNFRDCLRVTIGTKKENDMFLKILGELFK